jgi:hypothetical protein
MTGRTRCNTAGSMRLFSLLTLLLAIASPALAQTVSDGTFLDANWALTQATAGLGGSSTAAQVATGGNPGSYRNVTDTLNAAPPGSQTVVLSTSIYTPFTYNPSVSGPIASLNYSEDAECTGGCFGQGQSTGPAVQQGGNLYILNSQLITGPGTTWANHTLSGLTSADFSIVSVTPTSLFDNSQHPNFSAGGGPIQFGFFRANGTGISGGAYTLSAGIDNWQITIAAGPSASTTVPTLNQWSLVALALMVALIGLALTRREQ